MDPDRPAVDRGGLLFGIATFCAGILPHWAGALLVLSTVLATIAGQLPNASQPKIAIPMGLALAWPGMHYGRNRGVTILTLLQLIKTEKGI